MKKGKKKKFAKLLKAKNSAIHNQVDIDGPGVEPEDDEKEEVKVDVESMTLIELVLAINKIAGSYYIGDDDRWVGFMKRSHDYADCMARRMNLTTDEAMMLALMLELSRSDKEQATLSRLASRFSVPALELYAYRTTLLSLVKKGLLVQCYDTDDSIKIEYFVVPEGLLDALSENRPFEKQSFECEDEMEFFSYMFSITHKCYEDNMSTENALHLIQQLLNANSEMAFVKRLEELHLGPINRMLLLQMCRHLVLDGNVVVPVNHLTFLIDSDIKKHFYERMLISGRSVLMTSGLMELTCEDGMVSHNCFQLTNHTRTTLLKGFDIKLRDENVSTSVVPCDGIAAKELFFSDGVQQNLSTLADLVSEANYKSICGRLKAKGLREGFACLFYGAPGTGKTECVRQLARQTERDLVQVNISEVKSKWVGESEQNVRSIFSHYRSVLKASKRTPILLFNEADAVIGTRMKNAERSVDKMENAIQNIILQEMENFEGIMVATTNLEDNLDPAFDRRFLYKVRFERPTAVQREQIWRAMLPELDTPEAKRLSKAFDLSGGQIENVVRKINVASVLYGDKAIDSTLIDRYCREEVVLTANSKVGF